MIEFSLRRPQVRVLGIVRRAAAVSLTVVVLGCNPGPSASPIPTSAPTARPSFDSPSVPTTLSPEAIRAEIEPFVGDQVISIGFGANDVVGVGLRATGEELARQLHAKYGDAVELSVGLFPFPPPEDPQRACVNMRPIANDHAPLVATVAVERPIVAGTFFKGKVRFTNAGSRPFQLETSSNFSIHLFRVGEADPIGGSEGGMIGTGFSTSLGPAEMVDLEAGGGTASCDLALGYLLPAGVYEARALIDVQMAQGEPAFFWSEPTTVEVVSP